MVTQRTVLSTSQTQVFWNKSFRLRGKESTCEYLLEEQGEEGSIHCPFHMESADYEVWSTN